MTTFTNGQLINYGVRETGAGKQTPYRTPEWTPVLAQVVKVGDPPNINSVLTPGAKLTTDPKSYARALEGSAIIPRGDGDLSGRTYLDGAPVRRRVILMTQGPRSAVIAEAYTDPDTGEFAFDDVAPGNYTVIDYMLDNSRQALIYDWVVVS